METTCEAYDCSMEINSGSSVQNNIVAFDESKINKIGFLLFLIYAISKSFKSSFVHQEEGITNVAH